MTDHEMRIRLAEAMGWTDLGPVSPCIRPHCLWGTEPAGWFAPGSRARAGIIAPNPLESDRDAALLRAWCAGRRLCVVVDHRGDTNCCIVNVYRRVWADSADRRNHPAGHCLGAWSSFDEPDPLRRERLALCWAVVQALEAIEAGGVP
jgi:hypothetical protein